MAWVERLDRRGERSRTWRDTDNPARHAMNATLACLHYPSLPDSDTGDRASVTVGSPYDIGCYEYVA